MVDGIRIDAMDPTALINDDLEFAAMRDDLSVKVTWGQLRAAIEGGALLTAVDTKLDKTGANVGNAAAQKTLRAAIGSNRYFNQSKAANYKIVAADSNELIMVTANATISFDAVATLADGFSCWVEAVGSGVKVTFDPDAAELIDGVSTLVMFGGSTVRISKEGGALKTDGGYRHGMLPIYAATHGLASLTISDVPDWVNRIPMGSFGLSGTAAVSVYMELGDIGGIETTGYNTTGGSGSGASISTSSDAVGGFRFAAAAAAAAHNGEFILEKTSSDGRNWSLSSLGGYTGGFLIGVGGKALSDPLTQFRLIVASGTLDNNGILAYRFEG